MCTFFFFFLLKQLHIHIERDLPVARYLGSSIDNGVRIIIEIYITVFQPGLI